MFKEFKPKQQDQKDVGYDEIEALFEKGDFKKAYRYCLQKGYQLDSFSDSLAKMSRKMYHSRPGALASLIYKYEIDVGYDIPSILRSQLRLNDYHGFLKNVYRFRMFDDFKSEVEDAINSLKRAEEAISWRVKFEEMSSSE